VGWSALGASGDDRDRFSGLIGDLSVVLYYDSTATVIMNVVGLILAAGILVLLLLPSSSRYFRSTTEA